MSNPLGPGRTPLSVRFLVYYALSYLVLIGALGWFAERESRQALVEDLVATLETSGEVARLSMPSDPSLLQAWASDIFMAGGFRVTVIDPKGVVLADSHSDPAVMENHGDRPEVAAALAGDVGNDARRSTSTGFSQRYVALPPLESGQPVLRVSLSEFAVAERLAPIRSGIIWSSVLVGLVGVLIVAALARRMARPIERIRDTTLAIASGELDRRPVRSTVREIDDLGQSVSRLADELGKRLTQAEQANETLEVVLGALPQGTILVTEDEEVVYANPTAYSLLGSIPDILSGLTPHPFQTAVREARDGRQQIDLVVDHGSSPPRRLRGVASPFTGDRRVLLVVVDVTDRERVASVRRDFVANASHELKTPVSSIIASADALSLAVERGDDSAVDFARHVKASARQLDRLVSDLLDLSRLERESPELELLRLDRLVEDEAATFSTRADELHAALNVEAEPTEVMGNWRDLSIVVRNLLDNALRHTGDRGTVTVSVRGDGEKAVLEVSDTGAGVPSRDLERIFERFYRVDAARSRRTGGTGLGLAIVRHAVEGHGGQVRATSELGRGSTFTVTLPLAADSTAAGEQELH